MALAPREAPRVGLPAHHRQAGVVGRGFRMLLALAPRVGTPRGSLRGVPGERDALKLLCESLTERRKGFPPPGEVGGNGTLQGA